ncbi:MAG TPA: polysaccharide deacetylase family protein [Stellaceae bacterium]|nr:polysaccharide deacetylase family protein [Stellaceae bacterium]
MIRAAIDRVGRAAANPAQAGFHLWSRLHRDSLFRRYRQRALAAGLRRLFLIVSFDCDTEEDIRAAGEVQRRMRECGIPPCFAVPGELLAEGADTYRRIAATGAEFLNHGNRRHTYFDTDAGAYRSCFFYDQQPLATIEDDIVAGDRAIRTVLGTAPQGFRTPHFGTFQNRAQLRFLHALLRRLGYRFSSSTSPFFAFSRGPVFDALGVKEFPVSGGGTRALTIIDSWGCFASPGHGLDVDDYFNETVGLARRLAGGPGILNYYADPSHVAGRPEFFAAMAELARLAEPVTFAHLVSELQ